jgi:hypothetical protein
VGRVAATVAANGLYGASAGVLGAVISAWPGLAFVGSVELAMLLVRRARKVLPTSGKLWILNQLLR